MCFGDKVTDTKTSTSTANPAVAAAATSNIATAQNTLNNSSIGKEYTGPLTAAIDPAQQGTIDAATGIANNGTGDAAKSLINSYAGAPASSVSSDTIANNMSPYLNSYVTNALAPQLQAMDVNAANTQHATDARATGAGAFGDARTGFETAQNSQNANVAREGVIGNAYNQAFNTAIGAGAQDVSNKLAAGTTNANLNETALGRSLGGAQALEGLQTQQIGTQTATNNLTQQDTANKQADITAQYNNWLQAQQSLLAGQTSANQTVAAGAGAMQPTTTTTDAKPDNSGLALAGSLGSAFLLSDENAKDEIEPVGKLNDGQNVYSYVYKDDPNRVKQIGLLAQEVQRRRPDAVRRRSDGYLEVNYGRATGLARAIGA